jgi:hypothetical protein
MSCLRPVLAVAITNPAISSGRQHASQTGRRYLTLHLPGRFDITRAGRCAGALGTKDQHSGAKPLTVWSPDS